MPIFAVADRKVRSEKEIEEALDLVARLIDWYGDVYWPVFDRLEAELEARTSRTRRLQSRLRNLQSGSVKRVNERDHVR